VSLLNVLSGPLVEVRAGRLTRKLSAPTRLQPVPDERGTLALWLLPNDDLSLVWQATVPGPPRVDLAVVADGGGRPCRLASCGAVLWTELARFPAGCHLHDEAPRECGHGREGREAAPVGHGCAALAVHTPRQPAVPAVPDRS
jgi:hypothetical protein